MSDWKEKLFGVPQPPKRKPRPLGEAFRSFTSALEKELPNMKQQFFDKQHIVTCPSGVCSYKLDPDHYPPPPDFEDEIKNILSSGHKVKDYQEALGIIVIKEEGKREERRRPGIIIGE